MGRYLRALVPLVIALLSAACQSQPTRKGQLEQQVSDSRLNSQQLRRLVDDYVVRFVHQVENGADRILAQTDDPALRRNALLWKSNAISACLRAGSRPDALGAYLDVAVLNAQMRRLFESPETAHLFGPFQSVAVDVAVALDGPLREIEQTLGTRLPLNEELAYGLAAENPIRDLSFDRELLTARYIDKMSTQSRQVLEAVGDLGETVADLRRLTVLYAEILPKQARWQAELATLDALVRDPVASSLRDIGNAAQATQRLAGIADTLPSVAAQEREVILAAARQERIAATQELDAMRRDTEQFVRQERESLLAALREERIAATSEFHREVETTLRTADRLAGRASDDLVRQSNVLADRLTSEVGQLARRAAILLGVLAALLAILTRRPSRKSIPAESSSSKMASTVRAAA